MEANCTDAVGHCIGWFQIVTSINHKELYVAILLTLSPIVIVSNLILVASFIATRQATQNASNIAIFVISLSDLIVGAVSLPLKASLFWDLTAICTKMEVVYFFNAFEHFSVILTALLAVDRYLHMNPRIQSHPSKLRMLMKKPKIYYVIIAFFFAYTSLFAFNAFYNSEILTTIMKALLLYSLSIHIIIITFLYARGYLRIRKFTDSNPVYCDNDGSSASTPDYVRRLYKTVLVLISIAFFQYVPYCLIWNTLTALSLLKKIDMKSWYTVGEYSSLFIYAGSFTNCFAVLHFNKQARYWVLKQLRISQTAGQST